jgi:hypothetical protein
MCVRQICRVRREAYTLGVGTHPDRSWKVALDVGANDAPAAGDCCKLPGPGKESN